MKTIADQIKDLENTRAAKVARMEEVSRKSIDEGRSMDEAEAEEFDSIEVEMKALDADLVRLRRLEQLTGARAKPVSQEPTAKAAGESRGAGPAIIVNREADEKFRGQNFTRKVIARTLAQLENESLGGEVRTAADIAQQRWGRTNPQLVEVIRAGVAGHGSGSGEPGAELVSADNRYTGDFIEYLYGMTVYNRLGLREVPANVAIKGQDGAATGYWVGENRPIPVTKGDFSSVSLTPLKVAALAAASIELFRDSSPSAEMLIRDALVNAAVQRIDTTFAGAGAAVSGVSPAGILNGVSASNSSGIDGDALRADVKALYSGFISAKNATGLAFLMNPSLAKSIQLLTNALGQSEFPGITATGGTLLGDPVVTGDNVGAQHFILLKPSDIYRIGAMGVEVALSRDATIEMDTAPTGEGDTPTAQSASMVSMFQAGMVALRVLVPINFAKRRSTAVAYVDNAHYGTAGSP